MEGARHRAVHGVLGAAGVPVEEEARIAHVDGQSVGWRRPARHGGDLMAGLRDGDVSGVVCV